MEKVTAGRNQLGLFAPKFAQLNDDVLIRRSLGQRRTALRPGSQHCHSGGADGQRCTGLFFAVSHSKCEKPRRNGRGDGRNFNPCCFLWRLAEGMGCFSYGKGSIWPRIAAFLIKQEQIRAGIPYIRDAVPYLAKLFLQVNFIGRLYEIG